MKNKLDIIVSLGVVRDLERMFKEINPLEATRPLHGRGTAPVQDRSVIMWSAAVGLGALAYYGLRLLSKPGTGKCCTIWPKYVKQRIQSTFAYLGGSCIVTALTTAAAVQSSTMMTSMTRDARFGTIGIMIASDLMLRTTPYKPGIGGKQFAWFIRSAAIGVPVAYMCVRGGPVVLRAAIMTAGVIGGLSTIAICAPSEKILNMGSPVAIGLGVIITSSLASLLVPSATSQGSSLFAFGALVPFSGFLLHSTRKIIFCANALAPNQVYDPVNESIMSVYKHALTVLAVIFFIQPFLY